MRKILVIRNDKIGDFMLAWPAFAMLKQSIPDAQITALVPKYTQALAELCPFIDQVILDCGKDATREAKKALVKILIKEKFDAAICLFSDSYNARLIWRSKIPIRLAPATKWCQILYNRRITQRRSSSEKPEFEYNQDLIQAFLKDQQMAIEHPRSPYLQFSQQEIFAQKEKLKQSLGLSEDKPWLMIHCGSGGSANNLSLTQYADLITGCNKTLGAEIILTAGPGEAEQTQQLAKLLSTKQIDAKVYDKNEGLVDFTRSIACADAFIAGSTGPLHIAATLDVPTLGFFPAKRSATPLRWRPINSEGRHLAFAPPEDENSERASDMSRIHIPEILPDVIAFMRLFF